MTEVLSNTRPPLGWQRDVPLAPRTTLRLGGPAQRLARAVCEDDVIAAVHDAEAAGEPLLVLGGGSNVVIAETGFAGRVLSMELRGVRRRRCEAGVLVEIAAGEPWDGIVEQAVAERLAGIECLSGIPGLTGATPIQNVGAYGQQISDTLVSVRAYDRARRAFVELAASACGLGYRSSTFKQQPNRFIVTEVRLRLAPNDHAAPIAYPELARALGLREGARAPLGEVRETVIALRRRKGMLVDEADPDSRSVGSFFVNPLVDAAQLEALVTRARAQGVLAPGEGVPRFAAGPERWKVPAAWLVERAGFAKGCAHGGVGVSSKHALALVNRGGSTRELVDLARSIRQAVAQRFGVTLVPEPVLVGCSL